MFVGLWVRIYILTTNPPFLSLSLLSPLEWNLLKITSEDCVEAHWSASLGQCCAIGLGSTCSARQRGRRSSIQMLTETSFTSYMWTALRKSQFWFESLCTDCPVAISSSLSAFVRGEHCCIWHFWDKRQNRMVLILWANTLPESKCQDIRLMSAWTWQIVDF